MSAGAQFGIRPGGYRALDSLRMEKGYRYYGTDLTLLDNPYEAGLGFCVQLDKGEFNGREALVAAREAGIKRRLRTLAVGGEEYLPIYGGEAVHGAGRRRRTGAQLRVRLHGARRTSRTRTCPIEHGSRRRGAGRGVRQARPCDGDDRRGDLEAGRRNDDVARRRGRRARLAYGRARQPKVSQLSGGLTNENYLVEAGGQRYVMRIPGQSTELLSIDRANEVFNTKAAATTGIGPRVLEHIAGLDVLVLEFIPGPTMSAATLQSKEMASRMAASFRRLHRLAAIPQGLQHVPPDRGVPPDRRRSTR